MTQKTNFDHEFLSPNALTVLQKRYLKKDKDGQIKETPAEMFRRVAKNIAEADTFYGLSVEEVKQTEEIFYRVMTELEFLPNSPTLRGAGRRLQQLSGCFVLPIGDSIEEIHDTLKASTLVHKTGGGTGFAFSNLRPKGDIVASTGNVAGGPVSFMRIFNAVAQEITQGGVRMGANMGILSVHHPDIMEFISCKADGTSLTNFNISVAASDAFMKAVEDDSDYDLINPRTHEVVSRLKAQEVFETIVKEAWRTGDPGLVFIDTINRNHPVSHLGQIESTNPCVTGDTLIYTENGLVEARTLYYQGRSVRVTTDSRQSQAIYQEASPVFATGQKLVYRLRTQEGYSLRLTADHQVMTERGWVTAQNLWPGDQIHLLNRKGGFGACGDRETGLALGWLIGDGTIKEDRAVLAFFGDEKQELAPMFAEVVNTLVDGMQLLHRAYPVTVVDIAGRNEARVQSKRLKTLAGQYGLVDTATKHQVPPQVFSGTESMQRGFLQALFTADGSVQGTPEKGLSVRLSQSHETLLEQVQLLLLNFGIASKIYRQRRSSGYRTLPNAQREPALYWCKAQHDLVISKSNLIRFQEEIGFLSHDKQSKLESGLTALSKRGPYRETFTVRFEALEAEGVEEVYDLTEPVSHTFIANGLVVHNCGEQPLLPYESCNLGSINLAKMVKDKQVDWERLRETVQTAIHFLDNVIDQNRYVLPEIEKATKGTRKIGLGVMGFANMLVQLEIAYNSAKGLEIGEQLMKFISEEAKQKSVELAEQRGVFPYFEGSRYDLTAAPKVRNATRTTIAPTGTIGLIANTSGGIEPIFAIVHKRETLFDNHGSTETLLVINEHFEQIAHERGFYSKELMEKIAQTGSIQHLDEVPLDIKRIFITAHDITPEWHIKMQAAFQNHIDAAVSKTINFPNSATLEDVKKSYLLAYKLNCKGITIYRDGSRDFQVLHTGKKKEEEIQPISPPMSLQAKSRPATLHGTTYRKITPIGTAYITVNANGGGHQEPFEVFINVGKAGSDVAADAEGLGRLISLILRMPSPLSSYERVQDIVGQLRGIGSGRQQGFGKQRIMSMPDGLAQALAEHVGLSATSELPGLPEDKHISPRIGDLCSECGQATLVFEEGCKKCYSCGYSEC